MPPAGTPGAQSAQSPGNRKTAGPTTAGRPEKVQMGSNKEEAMTNFEAIVKMTPEQMEWFLDQVYVAGLNDGMYAARQEDEGFLSEAHFDLKWLHEEAESALMNCDSDDEDWEIPEGTVKAILRNACKCQ